MERTARHIQLPTSQALTELVRLLARQAAREWIEAHRDRNNNKSDELAKSEGAA